MSERDNARLMELTAQIVSAYAGANAMPAAEVPAFIASVHAALVRIAGLDAPGEGRRARPEPAVAPSQSVHDDYLVCLEDGRKFKSLKRHLRTRYNLSPQEYREKWGLPADYPMVAPGYAKARSHLARSMKLGQKRG